MSGFEVAGVVLGSLPLVISAFEHYAAGIATAKRFFRYKSEMRSLILQMNTERSIFINTMEQLLTGIVRIEHMANFVSNAGSDIWKERDIEMKLKDRLRGAYEIYIENVKGMELACNLMMKKLALDPDGKPQFSDPNLFKQEYKRLHFCISKSDFAEQLSNLKNFNQALTRLTKQSLELEPSRTDTRARLCPNFKALQSYARSLYETLRSGLQCGCQNHAVKLRLESRNKLEKEEDLLEHTPFRVIFTYTANVASPTLAPTLWKEADIRCILDHPKRVALPSPTSSTCAPHVSSRRVRFNQLDIQARQSTRSPGSTLTVVGQQTILTAKPTPEQIQDLCKAIARLQQPQRDMCVGYLLDSVKRKHGIYPLDTPTNCNQHQWAAYSLRDVLHGRANVSQRLTQQDKLRVSVDLASSVLQLYKTPWLDEQWGNEDVYFIQRPGPPMASIYEHPFVYRKLSTTAGSQFTNAQPATHRVIRNQTLFTLGVLLIELWYGKLIEELQLPCDLDCQGTPGVSWCTAERVVQNEIEFEAGKRYADVVRRCIRCDFDRKDTNLDNELFQHAVFDGVVAPLEKNLQQFNSLD
ncbi:hypothetical protein P153DRAFT_297008 [Dothidotthia symphoricarpi CBS 119687]|uniref:DUF7580 domain-containing protein n=1 Tax=Dothidotthia symphoricarpi CBS 119687 TaxID=1392245 RepID=A0A6A6A6K3_9PLEO|nr:uncharacterized protein P153DRAFT_297008 [Dothidotthia symphoricarpi CBS 119687]KAF2126815.1 hypothetical protein P153DRAFT_297008 [Dothidotthia symphoricarpi CBS 119687]